MQDYANKPENAITWDNVKGGYRVTYTTSFDTEHIVGWFDSYGFAKQKLSETVAFYSK